MSGSPVPADLQAYAALLQVPLFGALLTAFVKGWLVTGKEHDRMITERDKERDERIKAQDALTNQVVPTLRDTQNALTEAARALDRMGYDDRRPAPRTRAK